MAAFAVGQRVVVFITFIDIGEVYFRGEVTIVYPGIPAAYEVRLDQGPSIGVDEDLDVIFDEGIMVTLAQGSSPAEFSAALNASSATLQTGDYGQVVIEGFGLGAWATLPGIRDIFANQFIGSGVILAGIVGDGFNRFIISWEVPDAPASYTPGVVILPILIIGGLVLAGLAIVGWTITSMKLGRAGIVGTPAQPGFFVTQGQSGPPGRTMVDAASTLVQPNTDGTSTCPLSSPGPCSVLAVPGQQGLLGGVSDILTKVLWGVGIVSGVILVGNLLSALPRRR